MLSRAIVLTMLLATLLLLTTTNSWTPGRAFAAGPENATPTPTDLADLDPMTAAAIAMFTTATSMEAGADVLERAAQERDDAALAELAVHWRADARELRDRGIWMLLSQTAGAMIHDPDRAHQLDLLSLRANGETMIVEGESMIAHGKEMAAQVTELRDAGVLSGELADQLARTADDMVTTGERIAEDGEDMRDYAERMLRSIGE